MRSPHPGIFFVNICYYLLPFNLFTFIQLLNLLFILESLSTPVSSQNSSPPSTLLSFLVGWQPCPLRSGG